MELIDAVRGGAAAGIVLGVRRGDHVDVRVAGLRGPGGAPLTADTPFPVASITKPATAALLHALHARGDLDLDARAWRDATWRELLRHTGGAGPGYEGGIERFGNGDGAPAAYAEHPELIEWLGAPWSYANPGYWLAGAHAAAVSGRPFARGLRELVLDPAGVTGADSRPWRDDPALLAHDDPDPARNSYLAMPRVRVPSGGLRATVGDVLALAAATWPGGALGHLGVLGEAPFAEVYGGRFWGPGWEAWRAADGTLVTGHSGVSGGFRTRLWSVPARRTAVAVLAVGDRRGGRGPQLEDAVLDIALDAVDVATGLRERAPRGGPLREDLDAYAGRYGEHEVVADGDALVVSGVRAVPFGGDSFLVPGVSAPRRHVDFLRDAAGGIAFLRVGLLCSARG
ncbi:serine hydrolase domain-containing protein [Symbioplanes lichenis]|uniref:serine hydrolase domain-containing protein n=1 Tax=Symbioplanes lichenis TaxID=1629072 RepID=UPI00273A02B0|nr:serine hydrolase domain-containing protein [Actinoplanes lichenis]